jgi:hypothetical protein
MRWILVTAALAVMAPWALARQAAKPAAVPAAVSEHARKDITRHRAMAAAHEAAAKCLELGKAEDACHKELQAACKGLAIGKYCGMRHEH